MSELKRAWKGLKAGGCFNYGSWRFNAQYALNVDKKASVNISLEQQGTDHSICVYVLKNTGGGKRVLIDGKEAVLAKSGFKSKPVVTVSTELDAGQYLVLPCTFEAHKTGDFVLKSSVGKLRRLSRSKDWKESTREGAWVIGKSAGGCKNHKTFKDNPQFPFSLAEKTSGIVSAFQSEKDKFNPIGWYILKSEEGKPATSFRTNDIAAKCSFSSDTDATLAVELDAGHYSLLPCTFDPDNEAKFTVALFTTSGARFVGDTAVEEADEDSAATPTAAGAATGGDVDKLRDELVREKKDHLQTIAKNTELTGQIEEMRKNMNSLQDQIKALQSGAGLPVSSFAASSAASPASAAAAGVRTNTTAPQTGKEVAIFGSWDANTAGGCLNHQSWRSNPQIFVSGGDSSIVASVTLTQEEKEGVKPASIGFYIISGEATKGKRALFLGEDDVLAKASFTAAKAVKISVTLPASKYPYVIMPTTFDPKIERNWVLTINAEAELTASPVLKETDWSHFIVDGAWEKEGDKDTAGGCKNHASFPNNPQYLLTVAKKAEVNLMLLQGEEDFDAINIYICKPPKSNTKLPKVANEEVIDKGKFGDPNEVVVTKTLDAGKYVIIPSTFDPEKYAKFKLHAFSTAALTLAELGDAEEVNVSGVWSKAENTAGGCLNDLAAWRTNQQFTLTLTRDANLLFRLRQSGNESQHSIGFYILKGSDKRKLRVAEKDILHKSSFSKTRDVTLDLALKAGGSPFTIVPCTYNAGEEANFTFSVFAKEAIEDFSEVVKLSPLGGFTTLEAKGAWDDLHAGGCLNHATWVNNPQFVFKTDKKAEVFIFLTTPKNENFSGIGFYVTPTPKDATLKLDMTSKEILKKAAFRKTNEVSVRVVVEPGSYNLIPSTFKPGYQSPFSITVYTDIASATFAPVDRIDLSFKGKWDDNTAGGSTNNFDKWLHNPRYFLFVKKPIRLGAVLVQSPGKQFEDENFQPIGFFVTKSDGHGNPKTAKPTDLVARAGYEPERDVSVSFDIDPSVDPYIIVPSTFDPDVKLTFQLIVLVDPAFKDFVQFSDTPPNISKEDYEEQFKADALLAKLQKSINSASVSTNEVSSLVETAGLTALSHPVGQLLAAVQKIQGVLNALKSAQLINSDEELARLAPQLALSFGPAPVAIPASGAPPPPPGGGVPPPAPAVKKDDPVKATTYDSSGSDDLINILKAGRAQLKSAADRKLKERPPEKDAFCAFNMDLISKRRMAIEGEDEEEDDDDWDD